MIHSLDYMIRVMKGAKDGWPIEAKHGDGPWVRVAAHEVIAWAWNEVDYRIGPMPRKPREWRVVPCDYGRELKRPDMETRQGDIITVREVLPEAPAVILCPRCLQPMPADA